jgi:hypothetical protein
MPVEVQGACANSTFIITEDILRRVGINEINFHY